MSLSGHSFSFGLGDLRLWLRLPTTGIVLDSILGIYRLLQSDYRVDYLFEVWNERDAELLLRAGERNPRSSGARYMSRESFDWAVAGLRRNGLDASPPPETTGRERAKLRPSKEPYRELRRENVELLRRKKDSPPRRRGLIPTQWREWIGNGDDIARVPLRRDQGNEYGGEVPLLQDIRSSRRKYPERRWRSPSPPRYREEHRSPGRPTYSSYRRRSPSPRRLRPEDRSLSRRREVLPRGRVPDRRSLSPRGRTFAQRSRSPPSRPERPKPALAEQLADPAIVGRMAARAVWDGPPRVPPTGPRADREPPNPRSTVDVPAKSLLDRLTKPKTSLLDRLQSAEDVGNRALLDRMKIGLKERVSTVVTSGRRRAHNRPQKRLERLLRLEEDIRREQEEFRWTDVEVDWFIDQERCCRKTLRNTIAWTWTDASALGGS
ncbi:hypothetical protein DFH08DRAFT_804580, partial [Mycena albidolilacea]